MAQSPNFSSHRVSPALVIPALGWFLWFLLIPLTIVGIYSLSTRGVYGGVVFKLDTSHYLRVTDWMYLKIFLSSLKLASLTAGICLLIGYPMAYVMATSSAWMRSVLLILVIIPFWTNFVVRTYATKVLFGEYGPIQQLLISLGFLNSSFQFQNGDFTVMLGMVTNYLPFMVLPLFVALEQFDFSLLEAAKDLGASPWRAALRILIPLTRTGIVSGTVFVFTPALGEFIIPDLLGGAKVMLAGNLITEQFLKVRDWPFGASLSIVLISLVMVSLVVYLKFEFSHEKQRNER